VGDDVAERVGVAQVAELNGRLLVSGGFRDRFLAAAAESAGAPLPAGLGAARSGAADIAAGIEAFYTAGPDGPGSEDPGQAAKASSAG
jgi:hypothetical protein